MELGRRRLFVALILGCAIAVSTVAAQPTPIRGSAVAVSPAVLARARRQATWGWGQALDVDRDGVEELFVVTDQGTLELYRSGTRTRIGRFGAEVEMEMATLAHGGMAIVVIMTGSSHVVDYTFFVVHITPTTAAVVGTLRTTNALQWVSLVNLDDDPEPEVVVVTAEGGVIGSASVRVHDRRGLTMVPLRRSASARRQFAARSRPTALRGDAAAIRRVISVTPEDWEVQVLAAQRSQHEGGYPNEHVMWALAHAPTSERAAIAREFERQTTHHESWPFGLYLESFPCTRVNRRLPPSAQLRWTIRSSCMHTTLRPGEEG